MKIRTKQLLAFTVMLSITVMTGMVAYHYLSETQKHLEKLYNTDFIGLDYLLEADRDLQQLLVAERSLVFCNSASDSCDSFLADYEENFRQSGERWDKYKNLPASAEEMKIMDKYDMARKKWELISKQVLESSDLNNTGEGKDKAFKLSIGDAKTAFDNIRDYLNSLEEIRLENAEINHGYGRIIFKRMKTVLAFITISGIIIGTALGFLLSFGLTKVLGAEPSELSGLTRKIAEGDLYFQSEEEKKSVTGVYADMKIMSESLRSKARIAENIANGDLSGDMHLESGNDILGKALDKMGRNLRKLLRNVKKAADYVAAGADQIAGSSQILSEGASEQASSLEEISSSMVQVTSQIRFNAENAAQASSFAEESKKTAENGRQEMRKLISAMTEISDSSRAVAKVIKVIDEIAFQTNLLSLNAAVEAARAGRHGKGFAVVAGEIRSNWAGRSSRAAKETAELIESASDRVEKGNRMAAQTAHALEKITESAVKTSDLISEIAAASDEQARGIEQISQGLDQVDQVTQNNAANAQETASAAMQLAVQAERLRKVIGRFRLNADREDVSDDTDDTDDTESSGHHSKHHSKHHKDEAKNNISRSESPDEEQRESKTVPQKQKRLSSVRPEEMIPFDEDFS